MGREIKFTKGPWSVSDEWVTFLNVESGEQVICTIESYSESAKSNASLIACAPEMYEMLESACSELYKLIKKANKQKLTDVNSQTETQPDLHDMETCYLIQQLLKRARGE